MQRLLERLVEWFAALGLIDQRERPAQPRRLLPPPNPAARRLELRRSRAVRYGQAN